MLKIFIRIFAVIFLLNANQALANNPYSVKGIIANATAQDPTTARELAITDARRRAFKTLLSNLSFRPIANELFEDVEISNTIRSQQVDSEKIAGNEYSAILNIRFDKDFIARSIKEKKLHLYKMDGKTENYLILPAQIVDDEIVFWNEDNIWKTAIAQNLDTKTNKKFILPNPSIENFTLIEEDNLYRADYNDIENLAKKYDLDSAYILIFSYDEEVNKTYVNITYLQNIHKKKLRLSFVNAQLLEKEALLDIVAKKTIEYLASQDHKIKSSNDNKRYISIPISGMGQWLMIKNKIDNASFLQSNKVKLISKDFVVLAITYNKNEAEIAYDFSTIGIILNKKANNYYIGSFSQNSPPNNPPVANDQGFNFNKPN